VKVAAFPGPAPIARDPSEARVDAFLRDRVVLKVATLAAATDFSVDFIELEAKRGNLELVGEGRQRRIPAESARAWLLSLHTEGPPARARRVAAASGGAPK
jgi:hypothetical protein